MMCPMRLFDRFSVLIEMKVITLGAFKRPEEYACQHDETTEDRERQLKVDAWSRIRIEPASRKCSDQDTDAGY